MIPHLTAATLAAMLAATTAETHADREGTYAVGMMNWITYPIMNGSDRDTLKTFATSTVTPSIAGGWIIQEVADTIQGGANYPQVNAYVQAMDDAGMHLSLNYADTNWDGDASSVTANVTTILDYLSACSATLATNVGPNGPTIDINLDVEPKGSTTTADWISMLGQVYPLITAHNAGSPPVHATLSGFVPMTQINDMDSGSLWSQAWPNIDTMIVMAYRNLPCFSAPCQGTITAPCADGFMKWGMTLASNTPSGKHCSIALELDSSGDDLGAYCWKISFGTTGIYNHPGSSDPQTYRRNFLVEAMNEGWGILSAAQKQAMHPNGAFILHSYQWLSCFRDGLQVTGGGACSSTGACADTTRCVPTLASNPPDLNYDGIVNMVDLQIMQDHLDSCHHDSNLDGAVNIDDLLALIESWGVCQ